MTATPTPLVSQTGPTWATDLLTVQHAGGDPLPAEHYQALLHFLAAVHGFACLESFDHLNWISAEARDELFTAQIELLIRAMGEPAQQGSRPRSRRLGTPQMAGRCGGRIRPLMGLSALGRRADRGIGWEP